MTWLPKVASRISASVRESIAGVEDAGFINPAANPRWRPSRGGGCSGWAIDGGGMVVGDPGGITDGGPIDSGDSVLIGSAIAGDRDGGSLD